MCREKFRDKRHPIISLYFKKYGQCKFGKYCSYKHPDNEEERLRKDLKKLEKEVLDLKTSV